MALRSVVKASKQAVKAEKHVSQLYRSMVREIPRVLAIYDIDMPYKQAREAVAFHFRKHGGLKDPRVISIMIAKGYMELEETLMQWKQKTHLLRVLEPREFTAPKPLSVEEQLITGRIPEP